MEENQTKLVWGLVLVTRHDPEEILRFWGFENKPENTDEIKNKFLEDTRKAGDFKLPDELQKHALIREATEEELINYTKTLIEKIIVDPTIRTANGIIQF